MLQTFRSGEAQAISAILLANEAFYSAFALGDFQAMESIWSATADITCIHPGWPALDGRHAVIDSWRSILQSNTPLIAAGEAEARLIGDAGYVICNEHLELGTLIATNVFVAEDGIWKMVHHQAGITPVASGERPSAGSTTLQ